MEKPAVNMHLMMMMMMLIVTWRDSREADQTLEVDNPSRQHRRRHLMVEDPDRSQAPGSQR